MYGDIPEEYYDAAANMIWDFGEGIDELFVDHPDAIGPALGLIENNDEDRLAKLLWSLKILEPQAGPDMMRENIMRLSKRQLKRIIREEYRRLTEMGTPAAVAISNAHTNLVEEILDWEERGLGQQGMEQAFNDWLEGYPSPDPAGFGAVISRAERTLGRDGVIEAFEECGYYI